MCAHLRSERPLGRRRREDGMTIIELMIGMVVALLIGLAATGSAISFTASQRQGIGVGGMSTNITNTLQAIKSDVSSGGLGFFGEAEYLCEKMNFSAGTAALLNSVANFSPVSVVRVGTSPTDQLDVIFADEVDSGANVTMNAATNTTADLRSYLPAIKGKNQAVLLATDPTSAVKSPCVIRTVTDVEDSTDLKSQRLIFGADGANNKVVFTTPSTMGDRDRVALLGTIHWSRYQVTDGQLKVTRPIDGTAAAVLMRNVIAFKVQYGMDTSGSGPTIWTDPEGGYATLDAAKVKQMRAVRIGIVTRSPQREKKNTTKATPCEVTDTKPSLFGKEVAPDVTDWQCYRYSVASVIVPLRNMSWK